MTTTPATATDRFRAGIVGPEGRAPVVSVGNLAMGGRGKTPTVAVVARLLLEAGERPAILSRGYRRRLAEDGVVVVSDGRQLQADLDRAGDEPLMLARQVPGAAVLVCDIRAMAAAVAETRLGATVHVLDDGFQHRSLARDVDIVLVAPEDLRDRRLPFGRLRSPVSDLRRAHAVVVTGAPDEAAAAAGAIETIVDRAKTELFTLRHSLGTARWLEPSGTTGGPAPGSEVVALAGIAGPDRFVRSLEADSWKVAGLLAFRDHHRYTRADLMRIAEAAAGRPVLTTEKDAVRLLPLRPLPAAVAVVPLVATIEPEAAFRAWLLTQVAGVRA